MSSDPCAQANMNRRGFIAGLAALGAGTLLLPRQAAAQAPVSGGKAFRIDVHHHFATPKYLADMAPKLAPQLPMIKWTPARSIEDMDQAGVATAINSTPNQGVWTGNAAESRRIARECNEYSAKLAADYPGRYGTFAALALPDVEGSLREIEYALDVLKVDGIGLSTSYDNKWLGDPAFVPVFDELNRRKAVVYTHPVLANCCRDLLPDVSYAVIELATDTTRAIASLIFGGIAARCPNIQFIFSHAGGTMPYLIERFTFWAAQRKDLASRFPQGVLHELQRFYYDTAQAFHPMVLTPLLKLVPASHVVYGTDYPFRTSIDHVKGLAEYGFSAGDLRAIERDNAVALLPRWKA